MYLPSTLAWFIWYFWVTNSGVDVTRWFNIGIKHVFSCIYIRQVPWEVLRPKAAVFNTSQGTWRMLMHWNTMFDRYYCIKSSCGHGTKAVIQNHKSINEWRIRMFRPTDMDPRTRGCNQASADSKHYLVSKLRPPCPWAWTKEISVEAFVRDLGSLLMARHWQKHQKQFWKLPHCKDWLDHDVSHRTS